MVLHTIKIIKEYLIMALATLIIAAAVYFFLVPSHAAISSISGLSIVLVNFIPLSVSALTMILNVGLLIIGFILCGNEFGAKTVYTSILLPLYLKAFEVIYPTQTSITGDPLFDVICYIFFVSIGLAILFNMNASSGGLDIVAKILNKYFHMEIGQALGFSGMFIALSSGLAYDAKTVLLSLLGTYFNGIILDYFIFGHNIKKRVCILSKEKEQIILNWILYELRSGATVYKALGAYDKIERNEIITIVTKQEYQKLMDYLTKEDPSAFVTVYNVNEIRYLPKKFC